MLAAAWVTAIATLVLALGVPVAVATWLGTRRSDRRREQREREEALVREQLEHERALREAIDLLGSEKLEIRIGGIYALERSARDSLRDHPTIMEVLTAFVREHSHGQWPLPVDGDALGPERTIRPDIQAALTVIGRRNATHDLQPIDLSRANLSYANLTGADFTGADFTAADLTAANLTNGDLTGAFLTDADLTRAALIHARLTHANLSRASLLGASLLGADLTGALLLKPDLTGADFTGADLTGADLTGADLTGADLNRAAFTGANLMGGGWPAKYPVPEGWVLDAESGRLKRVSQ